MVLSSSGKPLSPKMAQTIAADQEKQQKEALKSNPPWIVFSGHATADVPRQRKRHQHDEISDLPPGMLKAT